MVKKTFFMLFIAVLLVSTLLGCGGGETIPAAIKLVPQKANMIAHIDLSQIIEDEDIADLYEAMPVEPGDPQTLDEALDLAMEEIGLDLRGFEEGLMFGEISEATGDMDYSGIMVKGTFEVSDLVASIESVIDEEFTTINYQGYEIYTDPLEETGLSFLGSDAFVIGPMEAVKDVIGVKKGAQPAIGGKLLDTYNDLGDGLVKIAIVVPPGAIEEGLQEAEDAIPLQIDLSLLADIEAVGVALAKEEQSITLDSSLCFSDSESAEAVGGLISLGTMIIGIIDLPEELLGGIPIPQEGQELLENLLENLNVSTSGSCLDISLETTTLELRNLIQGLFTSSSVETGQ